MSLFLAWVVCPLVLAVVSLGCGLLLEAATGSRLPGPLLVPIGLAVMVVAGVLTTLASATAGLTTPVALVLAAVGFVLSRQRWRAPTGMGTRRRGAMAERDARTQGAPISDAIWGRQRTQQRAGKRGPAAQILIPFGALTRFDGWASAAAIAVFLVYAAPVVLSGTATFAGYVKLDDTSTWLALTDQVMANGRSTAGLAPSSYEATVHFYLTTSGYPVGSLIPLGIAHAIVGQDVAWLFQPVISLLGALVALTVYAVVEPLVRSRAMRALVAFVAAQPALLYGYALWGGVKEVLAAGLVVCLAALVPPLLRSGVRVRQLLPAAVVSAAVIGSLSAGGVVWLLPALLPPIGLAAARLRHRLTRAVLLRTAAAGAVAVVLAVPSLVIATGFLHETTLTKKSELNVLLHPLSFLQLFGIWTNGNFRFWPDRRAQPRTRRDRVVAGAIGVRRLGPAQGLRSADLRLRCAGRLLGDRPRRVARGWAERRSRPRRPRSSRPRWRSRRSPSEADERIEATVLAALIAGGVLWSNALAYREVWLAPRSQLAELQRIGTRFAGDGPALITEYTPNGERHFLRRLDAESSSDLRRRRIPLRDGSLVPKGGYSDIDNFQLRGVLVYRTLVLGRSPVASRPPSSYRLVWSGRYYEVWQRVASRRILRHLPLGTATEAVAVPPCSQVMALASLARREGAVLATVRRVPAVILPLNGTALPPGWGSNLNGVFPTKAGALEAGISVPTSDVYDVWLGGSFASRMRVFVDGRPAGSARRRLEPSRAVHAVRLAPADRRHAPRHASLRRS